MSLFKCLIEDSRCTATAKFESALHKYFKFDRFCPGQREALLPLMHKRDVFLRMATGAGKSLCMFLAPLALSDMAVRLVISPLHGLMEQQVFTSVVYFPSMKFVGKSLTR